MPYGQTITKEYLDCILHVVISKPVPIHDVHHFVAVMELKEEAKLTTKEGAVTGSVLHNKNSWLLMLAAEMRGLATIDKSQVFREEGRTDQRDYA